MGLESSNTLINIPVLTYLINSKCYYDSKQLETPKRYGSPVLQVVEFKRRNDHSNGILEPFLCRANDNKHYFLKGSNANGSGLVKEWLCAHLGKAFGLPIPQPALLYVSPQLKAVLPDAWARDLKFDFFFAIESVEPCRVITLSDLSLLDKHLMRDVLVFDAWIQNDDRYLGSGGGNPNLLITLPNGELAVIDHNNAFADCFDAEGVKGYHVFKEMITKLPLQLPEIADYKVRCEKALFCLDEAVSLLPEEWLHESEIETNVLEIVTNKLQEYTRDDFLGWLTI